MGSELVFEHALPGWLLAVALLAALAAAVVSVVRYLPRHPVNAVLMALRVLFLLLLGWCLLLPMLRRSLSEKIKPRFVVALDTSASMLLAPSKDAASNRWSVALHALAGAWTRRLQADCYLDVVPFDSEPAPAIALTEVDRITPAGQSTHLRESLRKMLERFAAQPPVGLLLLSDGLDTREMHDDWAGESRPCRIYTVRLETPGIWQTEPDVRVDAVDTPRRVVVGWDTKLTALVSGQGGRGAPFSVQLLKNGLPMAESPCQLPEEGGNRELSFRLNHPEVGAFVYTIRVPPLAGETHTNDNAFPVNVQVVDARNRVLYVEGAPRWESKYLTRALKANPNITPLAFLRGPGRQFLTVGERGEQSLDLTEDQLALYKVVIVGDLNAMELGEQRAAALGKFVENGGSLVLLGGPSAWGDRGFGASALKAILPFRRSWADPPAEGSFAVSLTGDGKSHAIFSAKEDDWQGELPPVLSVFGGATLSKGATTLAEAHTPQGVQPVLVVQKFGHGKVLAVLTDSFWRWQLNPGQNQVYSRFWTQVLQWLCPSETELAKYELDLFADVDRLCLGERIALKARLQAGGSEPAVPPDLNVVCEITAADDRRIPLAMPRQTVATDSGKTYPGYGAEFTPLLPGLHRAIAFVDVAGKRVESTPYSFFVKPFTPEKTPRPCNEAVLRALALSSGGRFCEPGEVDRVLNALPLPTREEQRTEYSTLWHTVAIIVCLMALLALEWILRKARNMA